MVRKYVNSLREPGERKRVTVSHLRGAHAAGTSQGHMRIYYHVQGAAKRMGVAKCHFLRDRKISLPDLSLEE